MHTEDTALTDTAIPSQPSADRAQAPLAPPVRKPRRRRLWWIALACLLVLASVPVAGYFYVMWLNERDLDAAIAEIEATDPRWRFNQILADRPLIADADNPAVIVEKAELLVRGAGGLDFAVTPAQVSLFEKLTAAHRLNEPQLAEVRRALGKHAEAIKLARTLKALPGEGRYAITWNPDYLSTNLEPMQRCRNIMALLETDAMLRAEEGDAAGALESCQALLVTARSIGEEPCLIAVLVRYAGEAITVGALERTLAQGEPPDAQLKAMQEMLARELAAPLLQTSIRGERGGMDQLVLGLNSGKVKVSTVVGGPSNTWEAWLSDHVPIMITHGRPEYLRLMTEALAAAKKPPEQQQEAFAEVEEKTRASRALAVRLLMPALAKVAQAHRRTQANLRCALVAVAAERYRLRHQRWPGKLDDLVADGLLKAVPVDPYDGQPLRFRLRPDGAVVYSVGNDGQDNGGTIDRSRPLDQGIDQGFELWNGRARRQAPLPPPDGDGG